jgi:protein-disulfide isomerase
MVRRLSVLGAGGVALLIAVACQPRASGPPASPGEAAPAGEIAARVGGVAITTTELDDWIKEDMFHDAASSPSRLYDLREDAIERMVEERAIELEAKRQGVTPDKLIESEVAALGPVTDQEVQEFYDQHKAEVGASSFDELKGRIHDFLASRRPTTAKANIRNRAEVEILLQPPRVEVSADGPSKGAEGARVTIVEFSDFQCPYCKRAAPTLDQLLARYPNDVRLVYRHMPLRGHARARPAAMAALCADEQGAFWKYHDILFKNAPKLEDADLKAYAAEAGLDASRFESCLAEHRHADKLEADYAAGQAAGVTGTPAFFVNGIPVSGAKPLSDFARLVDAELARAGAQKGS